MAMMAKMRSLAPAFILGAGIIFVLFMVVSSSDVMEVFGTRSNYVGSINGEKISYKEFMKAVDQEKQNEKNQTGKDNADENTDQFRDQVWNTLVNQTLLQQQIKKLNISVSDQEIRDIILGPNPPEFLKRNFIDSTGKFNRQLYESAIYNPRNSQALIQAEDYIRQTQLTQKLQSLLLASVNVSEAEIYRKFIDDHIKMNSEYALVRLTEFPDSTIKVSQNELKEYYNDHLDQFAIKAQRKLKYVIFRNVPSADDSSTVKRNLDIVVHDLHTDTTSFRTMVKIYSSEPFSKDTLNIAAFPGNTSDSLLNAKSNSIIGPVASPQGYIVYNYLGSVRSKETFVRASHILINQFGSDEKNHEEAMKIYEQLKNGADFAKLAHEFSKDPGSAAKGGDLGWFGKGRMVPAFDKAAFSGRIGVVEKPIKTSYGYHIIKVTGKTDKKFIVEKIVSPIKPSPTTRDNILNTAKDFAYVANKDGFEHEVKLMNYQDRETSPFTKDAYYIPGIGVNQQILDFAFNNSLNSISDVYKLQSGFVVVQVSGVTDQGVKPFKDVKKSIKSKVIKEKRYALSKQKSIEIKNKINGNLEKAPSIDPKVFVTQTGEFTAKSNIPNVGSNYEFAQVSLHQPLNTVSDPIKGEQGYFLIKVLSRTKFDSSAFAIQKNTIRDQILQQKKNAFFQQWLAQLKKNSDIVDNRRQFFGL